MKKFHFFLATLLVFAILTTIGLYMITYSGGMLDPIGMIAVKQKKLLIVCSLLMLIVVIPVFLLLLVLSWRYREEHQHAKHDPEWADSKVAETLWWGVPFLICLVLSFFIWHSSHELDPFRPIRNGKAPIHIQAVALQWKWLFLYPEYGIASLNYLRFPEHTPLDFEITADAPMNSFWIPQLGGQIYAMPAMRTQLHLIADHKGIFRGCSANFSGAGFAGMVFDAEATSDHDFLSWVAEVRRSSQTLTPQIYETLIPASAYVPVAVYRYPNTDLFEAIIMKYMMPKN